MTHLTKPRAVFAALATLIALLAGALSISGSQTPKHVTILCTTDTLGSIAPCG